MTPVRWTLTFVEGPYDGLQGWHDFEVPEKPAEEVRVASDDDGEPHIYEPEAYYAISGESARYVLTAAIDNDRGRVANYRCGESPVDRDQPAAEELVTA